MKPTASFSHICVSTRCLEDGEPVDAFGYPLTEDADLSPDQIPAQLQALAPPGTTQAQAIHIQLNPRVSSAMIAHREDAATVLGNERPMTYVIDKALNYGNSGGPIIATQPGMRLQFVRTFKACWYHSQNSSRTYTRCHQS